MIVVAVALLQSAPRAQQRSVFRSGTELVLVNVVVRDKSGAVVRSLSRDDFTVIEDDKPQTITSFDFEELDAPSPAERSDGFGDTGSVNSFVAGPRRRGRPEREGFSRASVGESRHARAAADRPVLRPEFDAARRARARGQGGARYVEHKLSPADLIAVASFSTRCRSSRTSPPTRNVARRHRRIWSDNAAGFDNGLTGDAEDTPDTGNAFTADDTEFNIFNTDRRLDALRTLADQLAGIDQKKSVIYFSSGMSQQGRTTRCSCGEPWIAPIAPTCRSTRPTCAGCKRSSPGATRPKASRRGTSPFSGAAREASSAARRRRRTR